MTDVPDALGEDESVRERLPLRTGGTVLVTDECLLVVTGGSSAADSDAIDPDAEVISVALDDVAEVTIEDFDYFLAILSVTLTGYGLYSVPRSAPIGFAFAAFGAASLYWTYRKRGKTRIKVAGRPKPISVFPADTGRFYDVLEPMLVAGGDGSGSDGESG